MPRRASTIAWIDDEEEGESTLARDGAAEYALPVIGRNALMLRDSIKKGAGQ